MSSSLVRAGMYGELNLHYSADAFATATSTSAGRSFYGVELFTNLDTKQRFYYGFHIHQVSFTDNDGTTATTYSSLDMGPSLFWFFDPKQLYSLMVSYNIQAKGTYNDGSTDAAWSGTSLYASLAVTPEIKEDLYVGFKLNYLAANYSKQTVVTTTSDVSYSRTWIFPSFVISWHH